MQNGVLLFENCLIIFPVSVSQRLMFLSNPALKNFLPSFEKQISLIALVWPVYVLKHFLFVRTSHILHVPSWLAESIK